MDEFTIHACEQVLRFTQVEKWDNLSEALKMQLAFNMGVVALGLHLSKADGFQTLYNAREGQITMKDFHGHIRTLVNKYHVEVNEEMISRPF